MSDCPHCGQRMLMRHGVRLSPKLADICDAIEHSGDRGLPMEQLLWMFYPDKAKYAARNALKVSINHINDLMVATDIRVRLAERHGPYRVVREVVSG